MKSILITLWQFIAGNTATLILLLVYLINRIIRTPLWWVEIDKFKIWNFPPESMVTKGLEESARKHHKQRTKDLFLVLVLAIFYTLNLFVNWWWFALITSIVATIVLIIVLVAFIRIRRKRIQKEIQEAEAESF